MTPQNGAASRCRPELRPFVPAAPGIGSKPLHLKPLTGMPFHGWIFQFPVGSIAVHSGHEQDPLYAHLVPIYASSTLFTTKRSRVCAVSVARKKDIFTPLGIQRSVKPKKIAALETFGITYDSAPVEARASCTPRAWRPSPPRCSPTWKPGDRILLSHFFPVRRYQEMITFRILPSLGIHPGDRRPPRSQPGPKPACKRSFDPMVYLETPANPTIQCVDIEHSQHWHGKHNCITVAITPLPHLTCSSLLNMESTSSFTLLPNF